MITLSAADLAELLTQAKRAGAQGAPDYTEQDAQSLISHLSEGSAFCRSVLQRYTCAISLPTDDVLESIFEDEDYQYVVEVGDCYHVCVLEPYHLAAIKYEDAAYYFWVLDPEDINVPEEEDSEEE